jgi:hypothetical protein
MSGPKHRLDKLIKKTKRLRRIDESAVRDIIATTRELLEATSSQSAYPVATLYCNWSLHTKISASLTALRCLEEVAQQIRCQSSASAQDLLDFLSNQVFHTHRLRGELIALFRENDVGDFIFTSNVNWSVFASLLYSGLIDKRLQYPAGVELPVESKDSDFLKRAKRIYERHNIAANGVRRAMHRSAWISLAVDPWDERPENQRTPVFHTNVQTFDDITFVIKINDLSPVPEADGYALVV